jgi:hypothetical protein
MAALGLSATVGAGFARQLFESDGYLLHAALLVMNMAAGIVAAISVLKGVEMAKAHGSISEFHSHIDTVIRARIAMLAAGYPRFVHPIKPTSAGQFSDSVESVRRRFSSVFLWVFLFAAAFVVVFADGNSYSTRGVFSILTQSQIGRALAGVISSYISIWSLTFYLIGRLFSVFASSKH